ncbi:sulfite oxidase [Mucilaginibacter robiniae]|uniref:Sulfite oxidase n=2 Tax=Mucilaginibacter robiniae TaxID=2728022 RepID=A0A7L5EBM2_9SPHI|nr:sulfite oxidase [Mucilaginibacter robiniae]
MSIPINSSKAIFPGLITREREPVNLEFAFPTLDGRITPAEQFYVRSHFPIPEIKAEEWRLSIEGEVEHPFILTFEELKQMPARTVMATLECAGNGRSKLVPKAKGLLWEQGAVGNAEWTGVPLHLLLEKAGLKAGVIEIILEGQDEGTISEEPKAPGTIVFAHSLPLDKALQEQVLIAFEMNGEPLTAIHGYPVRAIIPGWYGMASVKWLIKITATATRFHSYWQTLEYAYWKDLYGKPTLVPVTEMQVKAEIARPALQEVVAAGSIYRVTGAAWSGEQVVEQVEISTDDGQSWQPATLLEEPVRYAWQLWEFAWNVPPTPGAYQLRARATDAAGHSQPDTHEDMRRTYMVNFVAPVEVIVK